MLASCLSKGLLCQQAFALCCRFKDGEKKVYDKEKQFAGKLKQGAKKAGRTAEHDYDRSVPRNRLHHSAMSFVKCLCQDVHCSKLYQHPS